MADQPKSPLFNNVWYERVKVLATIVLPGLGALYFALAQIWGFPKADEVVGTITAVVTFLGILLQMSSARYAKGGGTYDGEVITEILPNGQQVYALSFETREQQEKAHQKDVLSLKIKSSQ